MRLLRVCVVEKRSEGGVPGHPTARDGEAGPASETSEASEKEGAPGPCGPPGAEQGSYCLFLRGISSGIRSSKARLKKTWKKMSNIIIYLFFL